LELRVEVALKVEAIEGIRSGLEVGEELERELLVDEVAERREGVLIEPRVRGVRRGEVAALERADERGIDVIGGCDLGSGELPGAEVLELCRVEAHVLPRHSVLEDRRPSGLGPVAGEGRGEVLTEAVASGLFPRGRVDGPLDDAAMARSVLPQLLPEL
jgi:hypothetical protein